ncbi:MAG: hypothetical protein ACFFG0_43965 [Candidatus Thorarchaeota archaeon]
MIFEINEKKDKFLEEIYHKSMKELDEFFKIGWIRNTPHIYIVPNRKIIDKLRREKTEDWLVAWAFAPSRIVYLLDRKNYEKESNHKYSKETFEKRVKHELSHMFISAYTGLFQLKPLWLNEGVAIYLSGQNKFKKPVKEFSKFLESYDSYAKGIYHESGFFIEMLVEKFGKSKLLRLIKSLKEIKSEKEFNKKFKQIYGFDLNYREINRRLNKV